MFLFVNPTGKHGFELPGDEKKWFGEICEDNCKDGVDPVVQACQMDADCGMLNYSQTNDCEETCQNRCTEGCAERSTCF